MNAILRRAYDWYLTAVFGVTSRYPVGTNVYDHEWDVLAILDTCRVDALKEVAPEYDWLNEQAIGSKLSVGSASAEWMANTFTETYRSDVAETAYISCNAYARKIFAEGYRPDDEIRFEDDHEQSSKAARSFSNWDTVSEEAFKLYHCIWDSTPVRQIGGHTDPQVTTDRAVDAIRRFDPDRTVLHYQRPHTPYTRRALEAQRDELEPHEEQPLSALEAGDVDRETVWDLYLDELRLVLDEVGRLVEAIDGTVAISADHGESFGEFGVYGHPAGVFHPNIRYVPWIVVNGDGNISEFDTEYELPDCGEQGLSVGTEEQLEDLGYL